MKNFVDNFFKHPRLYKLFLFYLVLAIIFYWPVSFLFHSLKWDAMIGFFPQRYFVGECLRNNIFPLWNPYMQCGYPIYAAMESVWYPGIMLPAFLFGYNNLMLHADVLIHLALAGTGMYLFVKDNTREEIPSFLAGLSYMAGGFFLSHSQHLNYISGGAWLPFVLLYFFRFSSSPSFKNVLKVAVAGFLMLTGSYAAFTIILFYFLVLVFFSFSWNKFKVRDFSGLKKYILYSMLLGIIMLAFSSGFLVSISQSSVYVERFRGLELSLAQGIPFSPQSWLSFIVPFSTIGSPEFFDTDISMNNAYFGIIAFLLLLNSFFLKKNRIERLLFWFGIGCLLIAAGDYLPFRKIVYHVLPMMDKFKYPSVFIIFTFLAFVYTAFSAMKRLINEKNAVSQVFKNIHIGSIVFFFSLLVISILLSKSFQLHYRILVLPASSVWNRVAVNAVIQLLILILLFYFLYKKKWKPVTVFYWLMLLDLFIAVQLNSYVSLYFENSAVSVYQSVKKFPKGFPLPSENKIIENKESLSAFDCVYRNTNVFNKRISFDAYNSFAFDGFKQLWDNTPLRDSVISNSFLYFSTDIRPMGDTSSFTSKTLWVEKEIFDEYADNRVSYDSNARITFLSFNPTEIVAEVNSDSPMYLTCMQSNYTGWQVFVDSLACSHFTSNHVFISHLVPSGKHLVRYSYTNKPFIYAYILSYSAFVVVLIMLLLMHYKKKRVIAGILIFLLFIIITKILNRPYHEQQGEEYRKISEYLQTPVFHSVRKIVNVDQEARFRNYISQADSNILFNRIEIQEDKGSLEEIVSKLEDDSLLYCQSNVWPLTDASLLIECYFPGKKVLLRTSKSAVILYTKKPMEGGSSFFHTSNDLEKSYNGWTNPVQLLDSSEKAGGRYSCRLDSLNEFSTTLEFPFSQLELPGSFSIRGSVHLYNPDNSEIYLVLDIKNKNESILYHAEPFAGENDNVWMEVSMLKELNKKDLKHATCKFYVWNPGRKKVYADNFTFSLTTNP